MNPMINLTRTARVQSALVSALLLLSCAGLSAAPGTARQTAVRAGHHLQHAKCDGSGAHIFLCVQSGTYVDVTSTLTTANGQSYVTYQGKTIKVALNTGNTVYDLQGNPIGVVAAPTF